MIFIGASFINKILNIKPLLVQYLITIEIIKKKREEILQINSKKIKIFLNNKIIYLLFLPRYEFNLTI